jgi:cyclopropane-fatty-acyl-phospholipid synthase
MISLLRHLAFLPETLVFGTAYGTLQWLIRSPRPLDPEPTWDYLTRPLPPLADWIRLNYPPALIRPLLLAAKLRQEHLRGISVHYDVSNDFYKLFLDKKYMFYSAADFERGDESLEEAQTNKANFILRLIDPRPGDRILDLGCGWGSMMKHIYDYTGEKENLLGYTLSEKQYEYVRDELGFRVEFRNFVTCDYEAASFDKVYSIGSWEHVRRRDVPVVLHKLYRAIRPGGRLVKHFFCRVQEQIPTGALAAQLFFPGSQPPGYSAQVRAFEQAGFRITCRSIHDYRPTLRAWFDNLVRNRERALELVDVRTFNRYIVFFPVAWRLFNEARLILVRYVLRK